MVGSYERRFSRIVTLGDITRREQIENEMRFSCSHWFRFNDTVCKKTIIIFSKRLPLSYTQSITSLNTVD